MTNRTNSSNIRTCCFRSARHQWGSRRSDARSSAQCRKRIFDISRNSARRPAYPAERRPNSAPTQAHLAREGRGHSLHNGLGVSPTSPNSHSAVFSGTRALRPNAQAHTQTIEGPGERGVRINPDSAHSPKTLAERPLGGVRQDKDRNSCDRAASLRPAAVNKFTRSQLGNLLVVAPTRGGKGLLATAQLLTWRHSVVVNDIKGELFAQTAGYRSTLGPVFVLDPTGVGHAFDPLLGKHTEDELFSSATHLLFRPDEGDGAIFTQRAIVMLTQIFLAARRGGECAPSLRPGGDPLRSCRNGRAA